MGTSASLEINILNFLTSLNFVMFVFYLNTHFVVISVAYFLRTLSIISYEISIRYEVHGQCEGRVYCRSSCMVTFLRF